MGLALSSVLLDKIPTLGRGLLAFLFLAGAVQKGVNPEIGQSLLADFGLPVWLIWPAMFYNALAGYALLIGFKTHWVASTLAIYCIITSIFHLRPDDGWQMSIFIKNWAIAGGLLNLSDDREQT